MIYAILLLAAVFALYVLCLRDTFRYGAELIREREREERSAGAQSAESAKGVLTRFPIERAG